MLHSQDIVFIWLVNFCFNLVLIYDPFLGLGLEAVRCVCVCVCVCVFQVTLKISKSNATMKQCSSSEQDPV